MLPLEPVREGVADALLTILDATGPYPATRADILEAIRQGVQDAFEAMPPDDPASRPPSD